MKNLLLRLFISPIALLAFTGCGLTQHAYNLSATDSPFLSSGTIVLSRQIPAQISAEHKETLGLTVEDYSPVVGYVPPMTGVLPASNETWLEVDSQNMTVTLFKGEEKVKSVHAEGTVSLAPGKYALQYKQKFPTWYAPNSYFERRKLEVPGDQDQSRFRKGALGDFALYPTSGFVIHCGPVASEDVGGLRVAKEDLSSLFLQLPLGSSIVVK